MHVHTHVEMYQYLHMSGAGGFVIGHRTPQKVWTQAHFSSLPGEYVPTNSHQAGKIAKVTLVPCWPATSIQGIIDSCWLAGGGGGGGGGGGALFFCDQEEFNHG